MAVEIRVELKGRGALRARHIVVGCLEGERAPESGLPAEVARAVGAIVRGRGFRGAAEERRETLAGGRQVTLVGLGPSAGFDRWRTRRWVAEEIASAARHGAEDLAIVLPDCPAVVAAGGAAAVLGTAELAAYRFDRFRGTRRRDTPRRTLTVTVVPPPSAARQYRSAVAPARAIAEAIGLQRDLANTPPNQANPDWMVAQARALARRRRMRVTVLGPREMRRRGMGGILAVGGGSASPPRLVRLEWGRGPLTVALVGKGVTFDTGGISIKPAASMEDMKYDKSGACTVLGVLDAAARLGLGVRLRAYLPLAENMPDGRAYRPGDILRCANGKTVDIVNTDAEGRLILADALAWASAEKPDYLLEYSTLTGACVVALGHSSAGVWSPSDEVAEGLLAAAAECGERLWRMPLWPEFGEEMRGVHADLKNSGGRWGGANNAAAFLSEFVAVERWAHLDIAGPAYVGSDSKGGAGAAGATGYGVAMTIEWLRRLARG